MIVTRAASSRDDYSQARSLFREYVQTPGVSVCAVGFEDELKGLERFFEVILLGSLGAEPAACGALRSLGDGVAEMKRLYVRPEMRGSGAGRTMAAALVEEARRRGYKAIRLDTLPSMQSAIALYESMGFRRIPPYSTANPAEALCYELELA